MRRLGFGPYRQELGRLCYGMSLVTRFCIFFVFIVVSRSANCQPLRTLLSFTGSNGSYLGSNPDSSLTISGTTLYGTTIGGGSSGNGNIFSVGTNGTDYKSLLSFSGTSGSYLGEFPTGSLTLSGSTLYGITNGGPASDGTIFSMGTNGSGFQNLLSFNTSNSMNPFGGLTLGGSSLYGVASYGSLGFGSVFRISSDGTSLTTLVGFNFSNGADPECTLALSGSTLFGTTNSGGAYDDGTVFRVNTNGSGFQTLLSFNGTNGHSPVGALAISGSTIFGTTENGGTGSGNLFSISTDGTNFQNLVSFSGKGTYPGEVPKGLILSGSTLYGVTYEGGSSADGTVYSVHTDGTDFQSLHSFSGTDGAEPTQSLILDGLTLYGTTNVGGVNNDGTVFALTLPTPEPSTFILLSVGALGLAAYAWRKRRRNADQIV